MTIEAQKAELRAYLAETRLARAFSRRSMMTGIVIGLCAMMTIWSHVMLGSVQKQPGMAGLPLDAVLMSGGRVRQLILEQHEWWRLLSAGWLHGGWGHLGVNCVTLFFIGPSMERLYDRWRFVLLLTFSILGGSVLGLLFSDGLSIGISGGLAGLLGAVLGYAIRYRRSVPRKVTQSYAQQVIVMLVLNVIALANEPSIDHWGHLGGLLAGFVFGLVARAASVEAMPTPDRVRWLATFVTGLNLWAMSMVFLNATQCLSSIHRFEECYAVALKPVVHDAPTTGSGAEPSP